MKINPRGNLLLVLLIPLCLYILEITLLTNVIYTYYALLVITALILVDIILSAKPQALHIDIILKPAYSIQRIDKIEVNIRNPQKRSMRLSIEISLDSEIELMNELEKINIGALEDITTYFSIKATRRGVYKLSKLSVLSLSLFGFFSFIRVSPQDYDLQVFPDLKLLTEFIKLKQNNRMSLIGVNKNRWKGLGTELESLREYTINDDYRNIDWKASTRVNRWITKNFQFESNSNITIVLDCGRNMMTDQEGKSSLDHAIDATLLLSHLAQQSGDSIRVISFTDKIVSDYKLKGYRRPIMKLAHHLCHIKHEMVESDYQSVFDYLKYQLKKRNMVIFLTDIIDDAYFELFKKNMAILSRRHFPFMILLKDTMVHKLADADLMEYQDIYLRSSARELALSRSTAVQKLKKSNVNILDILPQSVSSTLINKYLEVKSKNIL